MPDRSLIPEHLRKSTIADAIEQDRVSLAVQPVFAAQAKGEVLYGECLARVSAVDGTAYATGDFVVGLEEVSAAPLLDNHVISLVLGQLELDSSTVLGCNLSVSTFTSAESWNLVSEQFQARAHLLPRLIIELTETREVPDPAHFVRIVHELRDLGCRVALDDFGTGFASPRLLQLADFDIVKVDKAFVKDIRQSPDGQDSLRHMVQLASCFSPVVVVEGVETVKQASRARQAGATHLQGYLLSRPSAMGAAVCSRASKTMQ